MSSNAPEKEDTSTKKNSTSSRPASPSSAAGSAANAVNALQSVASANQLDQLNSQQQNTSSSAALAELKSAEAAYDKAIDAMVEKLRSEMKATRPADPTTYLREMLDKSKIGFAEPDACKRIVDRFPKLMADKPLSIVVFGASGDLAKKKTFPALFGLYCNGFLPRYKKSGDDGGKRTVLNIVGYARSSYTQEDFRKHLAPLLEKTNPNYKCHVESFLSHVRYVSGEGYSDAKGFARLLSVLEHHEGGDPLPSDEEGFNAVLAKTPGAEEAGKVEDADKKEEAASPADSKNNNSKQRGNRLFYLALPPTAFIETCTAIRTHLMDVYGPAAVKRLSDLAVRSSSVAANGSGPAAASDIYLTNPDNFWVRVVVEKPFGHDTKSSNELADALNKLFVEPQIYRIDHYLGKEMVQNIISLRFANHVFSSVWNNNHIHSVQIVFKEKIGTEGRGGYFDKFGIIRDVVQNHLCQILALVGMEKPRSLSAEDVRDEKVALLRCVEPVSVKDCVIGQYTAAEDGSMKGYKEDEGVPKDSRTPTFAIMKLKINNDRWSGVPFILKAGKALEDKAVTVRIQFREEVRPFSIAVPLSKEEEEGYGLKDEDDDTAATVRTARVVGPDRNELVIRAQPDEAMYLKINTKPPGLSGDDRETSADAQEGCRNDLTLTELDLTYGKRFNVRIPEAYESLVNEAILGNGTNFVRRDELDASWRIFTPLLHAIDQGAVPVQEYVAGTRGPAAAEGILEGIGFRRSRGYDYAKKKAKK